METSGERPRITPPEAGRGINRRSFLRAGAEVATALTAAATLPIGGGGAEAASNQQAATTTISPNRQNEAQADANRFSSQPQTANTSRPAEVSSTPGSAQAVSSPAEVSGNQQSRPAGSGQEAAGRVAGNPPGSSQEATDTRGNNYVIPKTPVLLGGGVLGGSLLTGIGLALRSRFRGRKGPESPPAPPAPPSPATAGAVLASETPPQGQQPAGGILESYGRLLYEADHGVMPAAKGKPEDEAATTVTASARMLQLAFDIAQSPDATYPLNLDEKVPPEYQTKEGLTNLIDTVRSHGKDVILKTKDPELAKKLKDETGFEVELIADEAADVEPAAGASAAAAPAAASAEAAVSQDQATGDEEAQEPPAPAAAVTATPATVGERIRVKRGDLVEFPPGSRKFYPKAVLEASVTGSATTGAEPAAASPVPIEAATEPASRVLSVEEMRLKLLKEDVGLARAFAGQIEGIDNFAPGKMPVLWINSIDFPADSRLLKPDVLQTLAAYTRTQWQKKLGIETPDPEIAKNAQAAGYLVRKTELRQGGQPVAAGAEVAKTSKKGRGGRRKAAESEETGEADDDVPVEIKNLSPEDRQTANDLIDEILQASTDKPVEIALEGFSAALQDPVVLHRLVAIAMGGGRDLRFNATNPDLLRRIEQANLPVAGSSRSARAERSRGRAVPPNEDAYLEITSLGIPIDSKSTVEGLMKKLTTPERKWKNDQQTLDHVQGAINFFRKRQ